MNSIATGLAFLAVLSSGITVSAAAEAEASPKAIALANPAAVHCGKIGGRSEIRKDAAGNETGYCRLPNGRVCEEWTLFRDRKCVAPKD